MAKKKKPGRPKTTGVTPLRSIRVSDAEWAEWQRKAQLHNLDVSTWLRTIAAKAK